MTSRFGIPMLFALLLALTSLACSKDLPGAMKAVPADADMVGSLDAKAALAYVKQTMPKLVPEGMKDQVPNIEMLTQQAMQLAGIDISKLTWLHFFGYLGPGERGAVLAEGMSGEGLKGEKAGEHKGVALYKAMGEVPYAELKGLGLVVANDEAMLKKVIDTFKGDADRLADSERGKMMAELMKEHKDMDLFRVYMLTGKMPGGQAVPFKMDGGGIFFDVDTGAAVTILTDKEGADGIAQKVGMGLMALQAGLMMGGGADMPIKLDKETQSSLSSFIGNIKTAKKEKSVTLSYKGDLKPLISKVAGLGLNAYQNQMSGGLEAPPPPSGLAPPKAQLVVPPPPAPAVQ